MKANFIEIYQNISFHFVKKDYYNDFVLYKTLNLNCTFREWAQEWQTGPW